MIWHIVRKDLRLLWPVAAGVAAVNLLNALLLMGGGAFARSAGNDVGDYSVVSNLALPAIEWLGFALLVIGVIQLDRLPGSSQDWLTRPIPRAKLFAAKCLFVVVAGLAPVFLCDLALGMAAHFSMLAVLAASASRSVGLLLVVGAPAALIGAVTATLSEALVFVVALIVVLIAELIAFIAIKPPLLGTPTGSGWIVAWILTLTNTAVLLIAIPLQLRWRTSNRLRWILLLVFALEPAIAFMPVSAVVRVQEAASGRADTAVNVDVDASKSVTFQRRSQQVTGQPKASSVQLSVPVVTLGSNTDDRVFVDRAVLRLVAPRGTPDIHKLSGKYLGGVNFSRRWVHANVSNPLQGALSVSLPADVFAAAQAVHASAVVTVYGTHFRLEYERVLRIASEEALNGHTRCFQGQRPIGANQGVICESTREIGDCWEIRDTARVAESLTMASGGCQRRNYAPWDFPVWRDAYYSGVVGQFKATEAERDAYNVVLDVYSPTEHFVNEIKIPLDAATEGTGDQRAQSRDGVGEAARFADPVGMVKDRHGDLFIVDSQDSVIRKVTPAGQVSTFAGVPRQTGGNDGPGPEARFNHPRGIGIDQVDNLLIADSGNSTIRKITPTGVVSTLMTRGAPGAEARALRLPEPTAVVVEADGSLSIIAGSGRNAEGNRAAPGVPTVIHVTPDGAVRTLAGPPASVDGTTN